MDKPDLLTIQLPKTEYKEIGLALIDDPEYAMRSDVESENIEDLAKSIRQVGLIEPVVVKKKGDRYEVVAGHRRRLACERAGLQLIPCHVVSATTEQMEMMKIHENLYRLDINPVDEANHYARLITKMKLTPLQIGNLTNRGMDYVKARLKILDFPGGLQELLASGKVTLGVAIQLHRIDDPKKLAEMAAIAASQGITVGYAKRWVEEELLATRPAPKRDENSEPLPAFAPLEEQHSQCFYCRENISLSEAYTVYVHNTCLQERQSAPPAAALHSETANAG